MTQARTGRSPARTGRSLRPVRAPSPIPDDPVARLDLPVGQAGLSASGVLRRTARRLGVTTVRDLLFHLPRRYDDLREMRTLAALRDVEDGEVVSARVRVRDIRVQQTWRRRVQVTTAFVEDGTGEAEATWFGRRYIERRIKSGDELLLSGRLKRRGFTLVFDDPDFQRADDEALLHAGRIVPVYRLTRGLTAARLRQAMREAIDRAGHAYPEYVPTPILEAEKLPAIAAALEAAHYPSSFDERDQALRRLAFDELLALQLGMVGRRRQRGRQTSIAIEATDDAAAGIRLTIETAIGARIGRDVELTTDQVAAIDDIRHDLAGPEPMLRLLQGDVGSGKTAVAAWALAATAATGRQGALLAPTDLLARQHAATVGSLVEGLGLGVTLLTGSLSADGRRKASEAIASGQAGIVVGTHALFQEAVTFADLALAVVDEQHRFGVDQRAALEAKARRGTPHVLLMTATPIPRTLGQVVYADLDVSNLHTPPEGRLPIATGIRHPNDLDRLWTFVREQAEGGHRTFVVVPRIDAEAAGDEDAAVDDGADDDTEQAWAAAAEAEAVRLREILAPLRIGLVHGRLRAVDRDAEMARFRDGDLDVLVGTTVVEVGVDVPEATVMVVEGADRFGLAQLHQLRGRVGRGTARSYCALVSDRAPGTETWARLVKGDREPETPEQARLVAVARTLDGFELAEQDFALRREGNVLGLAQSGLPRLRVATLANPEHRDLAVRARTHAETIVGPDGEILPDAGRLRAEVEQGWLAPVFRGEGGGQAGAA